MIDIFSKFMTVIPLKTKQPSDVLDGIEEGINNMGDKPLTIYSDDEGSFNSKDVKDYLLKTRFNILSRGDMHQLQKEQFELLKI